MENRIKYLEEKLGNPKLEDKYRGKFKREARYLGNGVYQWGSIISIDTRELFLLGVLIHEEISFKKC